MAKGFAIHDAPTDHGGRIASTQMRASQQGHLFVRAGDGHFCPRCHCWSTVVKSHEHIIFDGQPVAYVGDQLTCGARIQPQQNHVVGESGVYDQGRQHEAPRLSHDNQKFDEQLKFILDDDLKEIFNKFDCRVTVGGKIQNGHLDSDVKTIRFATEDREPITDIEFFFKDNIVYFYDL